MTTNAENVASFGQLVTLLASAARTSSSNGAAVVIRQFRRLMIVLSITVSAHESGDTLDVYIDVSPDNSTWINAVHFTQQAGDGSARKEIAVLDSTTPGTSVVNITSDATSGVVRPAMFGGWVRVRWAIADSGDGDSSHTFGVVAYAQ